MPQRKQSMESGGALQRFDEERRAGRMGRKWLLYVILVLCLALPATAVLGAERFTLQAGTRWETEGCIADSGKPGPTALILGGVHGNEPAGALAAAQICTFQPVAGKIVVVPRVNAPGLAANLRYVPDGGGDMNRAYPPQDGATPAERMGKDIIALMEKHQISFLADLHEARTFHKLDRTSLGQTLLFADNSPSTILAMDAVDVINRGITDDVKKFSLVGHPIRLSAAWYAGKYLGIAAFTVETSSQQPLTERVEQQLAVVRTLLAAGGWLGR